MKKNTKAISSIIITIMILSITLIGFISLNQWYDTFRSEIQTKQSQEIGHLSNKYEILGIKQEGVNYILYIKSKTYNYIIINSLKLNEQECTLPSSNVLLGKEINKIQINCPTINPINEVLITSSSDLIQGNAKLTT